ncbi:MAG: phosphopantetheine-binding protein [Patescibacteria group bacterium]
MQPTGCKTWEERMDKEEKRGLIEQKIARVILTILDDNGTGAEILDLTVDFVDDLDFDSLDLMQLSVAVSNHFKIELTYEEIKNMGAPADLIEFLVDQEEIEISLEDYEWPHSFGKPMYEVVGKK